jgi:hypothetical protein
MGSGSQSEALLPKEIKSSHKILYDSYHYILLADAITKKLS